MKKISSLLTLLASLPLALIPVAAEAAAARSGPTTIAIAATTRGSTVAYDSIHHVYLVVSTFGILRGVFVDGNGTPLGAAFAIQASGNYTHFPAVTFSPAVDGGAGGFLVAWHESDLQATTSIHTRVVSYPKAGPAGPDVQLSVEGSFWEQYPTVAYSSGSNEFLVAWVRYGFGVRAVRTDLNGAAKGAAFTVSMNNEFEGNPSASYSPATNQYVVAYKGWNDPGSYGFVDARFIQAGTNSVGNPVRLQAGGGTYITDVTYNPSGNQFLVAWYRDAGGTAKTTLGRILNVDGSMPGNVIALSSLWKAYDGLGVAFNARSNTYFMVSHDGRGLATSVEDGGVELDSAGNPVDNGFLVTQGAGQGNFYPRITASTDAPTWLVSTAYGFLNTSTQLIAGTAAGGGGTPPPVVTPTATTQPLMNLDYPANLSSVSSSGFQVSGWAIDKGATSGTGIDAIHVYAWPTSGASPIFLGAASYGIARPDVGGYYGAAFTNSGFSLIATGLAGGTYDIAVYAHSTITGNFDVRLKRVTVTAPVSIPMMWVDSPAQNQNTSQNLVIAGWAVDLAAAQTSGVDAVQCWAYEAGTTKPIWLGYAAINLSRPDVGNAFGAARFAASGFRLTTAIGPGAFTIVVYAHSSITGTYSNLQAVNIIVR